MTEPTFNTGFNRLTTYNTTPMIWTSGTYIPIDINKPIDMDKKMDKKEEPIKELPSSGSLGGGKSSTANLVAKRLNFRRFSSGDFMRNIALEMGISINEVNLKAQTNKSIDEKIDEQVRKAGELEKIVIDSRLAFHWIPESFKVYFDP